jgi:hypothetical protein
VLLDWLFRVLPDVPGKLVASDYLVFAGLGDFEIRIGCLAADNADVLEILDSSLVRIINVDRHFEVAILCNDS